MSGLAKYQRLLEESSLMVVPNGTIHFGDVPSNFIACTHGEADCEHKHSNCAPFVQWEELDEVSKEMVQEIIG